MKKILHFGVLLIALAAINVHFVPTVIAAANPATPGNPGANPATPGNPNTSAGGDSSGGGLTNPLNNIDSLPKFMEVILGAVVQIGTIILTLAIVYVGFLFVQAQGNEEKIKAARSSLMWTVIGGLVLLGASTIGKVIESTVGALGS